MSFRRLPFQFSTTDPVERQRELERRFGLPSSNMYVDVPNPLSAGAVPRETNSPRLQHRVPIFVEGQDKPIQSSVDAMGSASENKKPNVRIIPIEIEGAERPSTRHRTFSGPAGIHKQNGSPLESTGPSTFKCSMEDLSQPSKVKPTPGPRVHNIPIQIEGAGTLKSDKTKAKKESPKVNGCTVTKPPVNKVKSPPPCEQKVEPEKEQKKEEKKLDPVESALKRIEDVLAEFRAYEKGVHEFTGTTKDKQYRYLDEMLTRCMLKLDELDTLGNDNLRSSRKSAVRQIQASIDLLESKANPAPPADAEMKQATDEVAADPNEQQADVAEGTGACDVEMQDAAASESQNDSAAEAKLPEKSTEVEMKENEESADVKSSEVMSESTAEVLDQVIDKVEENDVEMQNSNPEENKEVVVELTSEAEMDPAVNEADASESPIVEFPEEKPNEVPEVEMGDAQAPKVSSANGELLIEECDDDTEEVNSEAKEEVVSQDVDMKDVQDSQVNSTVLDNQCHSVESAEQVSDVPKEQCTAEPPSQSEKNEASDAGESAKLSTDDKENCVQASKVTDSSNSVDSSQN